MFVFRILKAEKKEKVTCPQLTAFQKISMDRDPVSRVERKGNDAGEKDNKNQNYQSTVLLKKSKFFILFFFYK